LGNSHSAPIRSGSANGPLFAEEARDLLAKDKVVH
jgi:hypothetical protein